MRIWTTALTLTAGLLSATPAFADCGAADPLAGLTPEQATDLQQAVKATPFNTGLSWQARRGDQVIDLMGTMHIYDPGLDPLLETLKPTIAEADLILLEMTLVEETRLQEAVLQDPERVFVLDGPTLPELLDPALWDEVQRAATERGIPGFLAAKYQPWFLGLSLTMPPCAMEDMVAGKAGLDKMIIEEAESQGIAMEALEPWDTLFALFEDIPFDDQLAFLQMGLTDAESQRRTYAMMLEGYLSGQIALVWEVSRLFADQTPGLSPEEAAALFEETEQKLLVDRNLAWMPVIDAAMERHDRVMVAVGAAHLPGEFGLLQLLSQDGWEIVRN